MGKSSDQLRDEIDVQRADAGAKIDQLQDQIQTQMDDTRQMVTDTATQVRDEAQAMVTDTVDSVKQTVAEFDFNRHVQERPLMSVGMAMVGGFVLGAMLGGDDSSHRQQGNGHSAEYQRSVNDYSSGTSLGQSLRQAARKSGLDDTISNAGAALMGSMTEQFKDMLDRSLPGFADKLDTARQQPGSFREKATATQDDAQRL